MPKHYQLQDYDKPIDDDPVNHIEPLEPEQSELAEALMRIVAWIVSAQSVNGIAARAFTLSETLGLQEPSLSWAQIADLCEVTREAVRQNSRELENIFGLRPHHARSDSAREASRQARNNFLKSPTEK